MTSMEKDSGSFREESMTYSVTGSKDLKGNVGVLGA